MCMCITVCNALQELVVSGCGSGRENTTAVCTEQKTPHTYAHGLATTDEIQRMMHRCTHQFPASSNQLITRPLVSGVLPFERLVEVMRTVGRQCV